MTGRNDPCPCGSGKKYKKCCLSKDQASRNQKIRTNIGQDLSEETIPPTTETSLPANLIPADDRRPEPEDEAVDPLLERINAFWDDFMDAPYEHKWAAVTQMLAEEPELCDGEMVFETANDLFGLSVVAGEIDRYKALLNQFEEVVPAAYEEELHYILDWRIQIALIEGDDAGVERYFLQFSPLAGENLDLYYRVISALAYHGRLAVLHEGMRQARPFIADADGLVEWACGEFSEKLGDIELFRQLEQNDHLTADDPALQQRLAEYELTIEPEMLSPILDYRSGHKTPSWTPDDFKLSSRKTNDPAKKALALLLAAFAHFAHVEKGVSHTKAEMACDELRSYIFGRHAGELDEHEDNFGYGRAPRHKRRPTNYYALRPDAKTLDRHMAQLMGFLSFRQYEAFALFELLPTWLRFLTKYELLDEETRLQTLKEMHYLKDSYVQIAINHVTDPILKQNVVDWPYDSTEK